jgi:isoamylase
MSDGDWNAGFVKCLGIRLAGDLVNDETERGEPIIGETLLILLNGHWEPIPFKLPPTLHGNVWSLLVDTAEPRSTSVAFEGTAQYPLRDRSLVVLVTRKPEENGRIIMSADAKLGVSDRRESVRTPPGPSPI